MSDKPIRRYWGRAFLYFVLGWMLADMGAIGAAMDPLLGIPMALLVYAFFLISIGAALWPEVCRIHRFFSGA